MGNLENSPVLTSQGVSVGKERVKEVVKETQIMGKPFERSGQSQK